MCSNSPQKSSIKRQIDSPSPLGRERGNVSTSTCSIKDTFPLCAAERLSRAQSKGRGGFPQAQPARSLVDERIDALVLSKIMEVGKMYVARTYITEE